MIEQRQHERATLNAACTFVVRGETEARAGLVRDLSIGGVFIETATPAPFGADVSISVALAGDTPSILPGRVRWGRPDGMGVQFGLLGAKETHLITEVTRLNAK